MPDRSTTPPAESPLEVTLNNDAIRIGPHLSVNLQRTLRIPDDGKQYPLPPGLGRFPIKAVEDYRYRVPSSWRERGGYFIPMHSREAMWLSFSMPSWRACALKVGAGEINAVSGAGWSPELADDPDQPDYVVCPEQPWLDGFNAGEGMIRQFVAVPLGHGYTAEEQLTGAAEVGGIQLRAFEPKPGRFPDEPPKPDPDDVRFMVCCDAEVASSGGAPDMGLGAGGRMTQKIYPDPHGIDTWDTTRAGEVFIHLADPRTWFKVTGELAPPSPVDADAYTRAGYPWFELDDGELPLHRRSRAVDAPQLGGRDRRVQGSAPGGRRGWLRRRAGADPEDPSGGLSMGIDLLAPCLAIPRGTAPDWERAAEWIAGMPMEVLTDTGDELFPVEMWMEEAEAEGGEDIAPFARRDLLAEASLVRGAVENPVAANLIFTDLPGHRVYLACALDAGADIELTDAFILFAESGIARAAGFDHWTRFASRPLAQRMASSSTERGAEVEAITPGPVAEAMVGPESIAFIAAERIDWPKAELNIERFVHDPEERASADADLDVIRGYLERDEYSRMLSSERIGTTNLWLFADCNEWGERAVEAISRLGACGALWDVGIWRWEARGRRRDESYFEAHPVPKDTKRCFRIGDRRDGDA